MDGNDFARARAKLAARIQSLRSLTHAQRGIAKEALMAADRKTGRAMLTYERLMQRAGAARSTVADAIKAMERELRDVLEVVRRKAERPGRNGGTVRANDVNLYLWTLKIEPPAHKSERRGESTDSFKSMPMDPGLAAVLARYGSAIADERDRCSRVNTHDGCGNVHA